jgi:hypothetical protein
MSWAAGASAHKPSDSYLTLEIPSSGEVLQGQWDIALRDLDFVIGLDANHDGAITWGELKAARNRIADYALTRLTLEAVGRGERRVCSPRLAALLVDEHVDGHYAVLRFSADCGLRPVQLTVHYQLMFEADPTHRGLLQVTGRGSEQAAVLSREAPRVSLNVSDPGRWQQFAAFLGEGIWHILKGYDHVLFLLTLLLPAVMRRTSKGREPVERLSAAVWPVAGIVTAFTVAHSITLGLAALKVVSLTPAFIEPAIAATIVLAALDNVLPIFPVRRVVVAFFFGLIHGFGFASVLAELELPRADFAWALLQFNLGIEAGQLVIVLVATTVLSTLRRWPGYARVVIGGGSAVAIAIGALWFVERTANVSILTL